MCFFLFAYKMSRCVSLLVSCCTRCNRTRTDIDVSNRYSLLVIRWLFTQYLTIPSLLTKQLCMYFVYSVSSCFKKITKRKRKLLITKTNAKYKPREVRYECVCSSNYICVCICKCWSNCKPKKRAQISMYMCLRYWNTYLNILVKIKKGMKNKHKQS